METSYLGAAGSPIHLQHETVSKSWEEIRKRRRTGAQRVVVHFELLAGLEVLALGVYASEVVAVVLPAIDES
jgi:hypothetical protein